MRAYNNAYNRGLKKYEKCKEKIFVRFQNCLGGNVNFGHRFRCRKLDDPN